MRTVRYSTFVSNSEDDCKDRLLLPGLLYTRMPAGDISVSAVSIVWWSWGFGIAWTVIKP